MIVDGQEIAVQNPNGYKEMTFGNSVLLLDKNDSFEAVPNTVRGRRLFCVLVPLARKKEFEESKLIDSLIHATDKILFYTDAEIYRS